MLQIKNLSAGVVKNWSLDVPAGGRVVLRGANGIGKTTIARAIMGEIPSAGEIILDGASIAKMPTVDRARAGLFYGAQIMPEIPGLSVMTFLKHSFMAVHGERPIGEFMSALQAAREPLDIPDSWLGRSVNVGFSGGEKKRLMFLHLLLSRPKMAILDEPDSGADEPTRRLLADIINRMAGTAFLVISHQQVFFEHDERGMV